MANLDFYFQGTKNYIRTLPRAKLYTYLFALVAVFGAFVIGISLIQRESYALLFSGLTIEEASGIVARLKEMKIPYRIEAGGTSIYVPKEKLYEARLNLASQNALPGGAGVGFEIFDKTSYGMTEFLQNVNLRRALQGELQRTINQLPEVRSSRVHISIPEKSIYLEKEKEPQASVFVKLKPGRTLSREQVLGIVHLVASSVEGLKPENVVVVGSNGQILFKGGDRQNPLSASSHHFELQRTVERRIEESVQSMLDKFLNPGKSIVRASVELNLKKVEKLEEEYHPEKVVPASEKRLREKATSKSGSVGGVPGVRSNLSSEVAKEAERNQSSEREELEVGYEVSKVVRKIVEPYGDVKRISIAVVVDGRYEVTKTKNSEEIKYIPRSEKELEDIRRLISRAVGLNEERGDRIEVINIPFETEAFSDEKEYLEREEKRQLIITLTKYGLYLILGLVLLLVVLRPIVSILRETALLKRSLPGEIENRGEAERIGILEGLAKPALEQKESKARELDIDKDVVAAVIKEWIRERA